MMKFFSALLLLISCQLHAQINIDAYNILEQNNQVVYVTLPGWNATQGTMHLLERKNKHHAWSEVDSFSVVIGRSGLGIDKKNEAIISTDLYPVKQEGDGRSPAGIYKLGPIFSYHHLDGLHMHYKQVDSTDICVDDKQSVYYNTWVDVDTARKDWNSFEYLRRNDSLYEYGVWVNYNTDSIFTGNGSCIFLHIWQGENSTTSGCTAMDKQNLLKLIYWLDQKKHPVLLQVVQ